MQAEIGGGLVLQMVASCAFPAGAWAGTRWGWELTSSLVAVLVFAKEVWVETRWDWGLSLFVATWVVVQLM